MTDEERVDELLAEWRAAQDDGLVREPESVIREHPDLADSLRARFDALGTLRAGFATLGDAPAHLPEHEESMLPVLWSRARSTDSCTGAGMRRLWRSESVRRACTNQNHAYSSACGNSSR